MKKVFYSGLALLALAFSASSMQVFAATTNSVSEPLCPTGFGSLCSLQIQNGGGAIGAFIQLLLVIAILICLFYLIYGGVRYIMSGGDKGKVDQARSTLVAALVGLIIACAAFFIVNLVLSFFTGNGLAGLKIPKLTQ
jgi:ABC-type Fe3+ transport system permease subunit